MARPLGAPRVTARPRWRATAAVVVLNLAAAAAVVTLVGPLGDPGAVVRAGAAMPSAIDAGEWWRLLTCVWLHFDILHLTINLMCVWLVGRWVESLYGSAAMLAMFGTAGLVGSLTSHLAGGVGLGAGVSGAVFGLIGAAAAELLARRPTRGGAGSSLGMRLLVVALAQLLVDLALPAVDRWAHAGGFLVGVLLGLAWSPHRPPGRARRAVTVALASALAAATAAAAALVIATPVTTTYDRGGLGRHVVGGVAVTAPARWRVDGDEVGDAELSVWLAVAREPVGTAAEHEAYLADEPSRTRARGLGRSSPATPRIELPAGWGGHERTAVVDSDVGDELRYRVLTAIGPAPGSPGQGLRVSLYLPETLVAPLARRLAATLASLQVVTPPPAP
ncbi:MAG: rhomboid family intramembrane serine protease [Kofleriaceae bacterium]